MQKEVEACTGVMHPCLEKGGSVVFDWQVQTSESVLTYGKEEKTCRKRNVVHKRGRTNGFDMFALSRITPCELEPS